MSVIFRWITRLFQYSNLLSLRGEKDAEMPTSKSTVPFFPFEILHSKRQWSHLIENRFANLQGQNNNSIKSLSHPIQTAEVEMKISCLCTLGMFLTQQSVSHPLLLGPEGQSVPHSLRNLFVISQICKKKKKDTKCLAWWKREFAEHFHTFFSPCINFQCCTLSGGLRISPSIYLGDAPDGLEQHCTNLSADWLC